MVVCFFSCDVFVVRSSRRLHYCKASFNSESENKDEYESFFSVFVFYLSQFVDVSSGNIIGVNGRTRVKEHSRFCAIFVHAFTRTVAVAKKTNLCTLYFQNKGLLQKMKTQFIPKFYHLLELAGHMEYISVVELRTISGLIINITLSSNVTGLKDHEFSTVM